MNIYGSAKGGVTLPNKNNLSVAFGGAAGVTEYSTETYDSQDPNFMGPRMYTGSNDLNGIEIVDINSVPTNPTLFKMNIQRKGTSSETVYGQIITDGGTVVETVTSSNHANSSTLLDSGVGSIVNFTFSGTVTIANGYRIVTKIAGTDSNNSCGMNSYNGRLTDGITKSVIHNGGWNDLTYQPCVFLSG